jgi:hypothetical protein
VYKCSSPHVHLFYPRGRVCVPGRRETPDLRLCRALGILFGQRFEAAGIQRQTLSKKLEHDIENGSNAFDRTQASAHNQVRPGRPLGTDQAGPWAPTRQAPGHRPGRQALIPINRNHSNTCSFVFESCPISGKRDVGHTALTCENTQCDVGHTSKSSLLESTKRIIRGFHHAHGSTSSHGRFTSCQS